VKTQKERDEERRRQKLEEMQEQIESGSLEVRQMTDEERKRYPPKERKPKKKR
jgi:anti-sigma28 factor (negative regulator of flagellin synthesis)